MSLSPDRRGHGADAGRHHRRATATAGRVGSTGATAVAGHRDDDDGAAVRPWTDVGFPVHRITKVMQVNERLKNYCLTQGLEPKSFSVSVLVIVLKKKFEGSGFQNFIFLTFRFYIIKFSFRKYLYGLASEFGSKNN